MDDADAGRQRHDAAAEQRERREGVLQLLGERPAGRADSPDGAQAGIGQARLSGRPPKASSAFSSDAVGGAAAISSRVSEGEARALPPPPFRGVGKGKGPGRGPRI